MRKFLAAVAALCLFSVVNAAQIRPCDSGAWYDPDYSGNGITIQTNADASLIWVTWYTYDNAGNPLWLTTSATPEVSGDLYTFDLGYTRGAINGAQPSLVQDVGSLSLTPNDDGTIAMSWAIDPGTAFCYGFSPVSPLCGGSRTLVNILRPLQCAD